MKSIRSFKINPFVFSASVLFGLIAGFRLLGRGADFVNYELLFSTRGEYSIGVEPFWVLLRKVSVYIGGAPIVFVLVSIFTLNVFYKSVKQHTAFKYAGFVFYLFTFYILHQYTQIRAAAAISIFFLSWDDLRDRKFKPYLFKTLAAVCFHYSALLMLPLYIYTKIKNKKIYLFLPILFFLVDVFFVRNIEGAVSAFLDFLSGGNALLQFVFAKISFRSGEGSSIFNKQYLSFLSILITLAFVIIFNKKRPILKDELLAYKILSFVCFSFYFIFPTGLTVLLFRVPEYFSPVVIFALLMLASKFKERYLILFVAFIYVLILSMTFCRAVFFGG